VSSLSRGARTRSRVCIDIGPNSIAGAYVAYPRERPPVLCYDKRVPVIARPGETSHAALVRALDILGEALIREGAPALAQTTGSGSIDEILVSIDSPWESTVVRTEEVGQDTLFTLTKRMVTGILARGHAEKPVDPAYRVEEHVVDIRLNGYQTKNPYGKRARRASLIILTSSIDTALAGAVESTLARYFHASEAVYISGPSLRFQSLRKAFIHERDLLIIDTVGQGVTLSLVRSGTLVVVTEAFAYVDTTTFVAAVLQGLGEITKAYPLPRTLLLLAGEEAAPSLVAGLGSTALGALWLSDKPPRVISVSGTQLPPVTIAPLSLPDIRLMLMAHYQEGP